MARTLLVTNDFPPRAGGIQTYLQALADRLPAGELVVYAPAWEGASAFDARRGYPVHRHPTSLMLPTPDVARRAADLAREHGAETVWFGAAAPLALLGRGLRERAGIGRVVASTHGHEVGWSMLPGARQALRRIGSDADVLTVVSRYTRGRVAAAFGARAALEHLPPGIDADVFRPDPAARAELRARYGLGEAPVVGCVSRLVARKGQDMLVRALPALRERVPGTRLLLVGGGPDDDRLRRLAADAGVAEHVVFTGAVPADELAAHQAVADVFSLPCRTRGRGLDVEGLGIVLLEASASGVPVVAGDSGGAPETVREGVTGHVVDGRDLDALVTALGGLLADPDRAAGMGAAGREWMLTDWTWEAGVARLRHFLAGTPVGG
ncbi:GDP-mannose-dependent alpha-(1-6)-phosphatidylinositol monomannoside mannosyltransferase [Pseudonocardia sulfidoxydans NBRC 16205]|uniref:GDP-mannose-dependent alpha-(1-6)-phosphatidylinositol monomannoside mannosyltransferase n=1 Tax=Pseudonocardia sulfidoxydans NBRC 16205 TaxID=1223511 RepID=A0A511DL06_9PSEU|nr:glycosyltransferase family 4 protein [Pseudonocardia sulfidoxydans]GEL25475.1 GDP-mannose-dependent alpha-(1-6)-phosphatidylinositol monomannoside mannosyltransferase [Pseudonocardia sulfidoxydans NBRC 16205]